MSLLVTKLALRSRGAFLLGVAWLIGFTPAAVAQRPLPPQEVFRYEVSVENDAIVFDFEINDGAYLYRETFGFDTEDSRIRLGAARIPDGEVYYDPYLEETHQIYHDALQIQVPFTRTAAADSVEIEMRLRGCDDNFGICYPPQRWMVMVDLPPGPIATSAPAAGAGLAGSLFAGAGASDLLPLEQAFIANPRFDTANELTVSWQIAPGYYLYRDQFTFDVEGQIQFGAARLPAGVELNDQNYGDTEVYYNLVETGVPFARAHPDEQLLAITVGFQGCKEDSICYPPAQQVFEIVLPAASSSEFVSAAPVLPETEQSFFTNVIANGALLGVVGVFFVAGLGLSLTPCVYPMVPILSSIIAGQSNVSTGRSFFLSLSYVLGMAVTYAAAGAITALSGSQVQAIFQQPWILASVAGLFVVMALAMFGAFELQMPAAVQSRITALANRQKTGSFFGVAIIGALSALIVTTCVAPPLIVALAAIGQSGDVARGSLALFVLALGMGTPLLLIGASAGKLLPKVGPWMNVIKAGFGVVMVGMAIYLLERVLPGTVILLLWALLVFLTGVFLGAFESLPPEPRPARRLAKGLGVLACIYGALMLIGSTLGGEDPLRPIPQASFGFAGAEAGEQGPEFINIETVAELESYLGQARAAGQPVMVDFTADWCTSCKEMEELTFPAAGVVAALEPFLLLRADVTENNDDDQALLEHFRTYGPPVMAFYDRDGTELDSLSYWLYGYVKADDFAAHVTAIAAL